MAVHYLLSLSFYLSSIIDGCSLSIIIIIFIYFIYHRHLLLMAVHYLLSFYLFYNHHYLLMAVHYIWTT